MRRRASRPIKIGDVTIGGGAPVAVQSMTKTDTRDARATTAQIRELAECGCQIVRIAVPDKEAAQAIPDIKRGASIPIIADIHFDHRLALLAIEAGVDGLRINPGNIRDPEQIKKIVLAAREREVPIRIGVNAGSLPPAKGADVPTTIEANKAIAQKMPYPLHLGITEAGTPRTGIIRSAVGIGTLLYMGIGDTIRVSLSGDPRQEVTAGYEILKSLELSQRGPTLISCPSCGRAEVDIIALANAVEERLVKFEKPIKVAVMGCVVNGPGEARDADVGIACGKGRGVIFRKGEQVRTVEEKDFLDALMAEVEGL